MGGKNSTFSDIIKILHVGRCPELIPDIEKFLPVAIFIEQCWISAVLWRPFWKWRPVEIFRCRESIQDVEIKECGICAALWRPFWKWWLVEIFSILWINSGYHNLPPYQHFQNGLHNTAEIQHCSISKVAFDWFFKPVVK
jgi:hypothetical protein